LKSRVPTKVTSKRISQANYFYRTMISRACTHPQNWNLIDIKYPITNLFYSFIKLSFPLSAFNAHTNFLTKSEKRFHENKQKLCELFQQLSLMLKSKKFLWSNKHSDCMFNGSFTVQKAFGVWQSSLIWFLLNSRTQNVEWVAENKNNALSVPHLVKVQNY